MLQVQRPKNVYSDTRLCFAGPFSSLSAVVQQVIKNNLMLHFFRRRCIFNMQDAHLHTVKSNMTRPKNYISPSHTFLKAKLTSNNATSHYAKPLYQFKAT